MITTNRMQRLGGMLALCALSFLAAAGVAAQTTTGTVRGHVRDQNGAPLAAAEVQARNASTGVLRTTTTRQDGSYALPGLVPATYELSVRAIGHSPQTRQLVVQVGATLLADFSLQAGAIQVAGVSVEAEAPQVELRTSEIATNVTPQQVEQLPTPSRNFLDLATLAPGVQVSEDRIDASGGVSARRFQAGGASPNQVNVFVDGASLKNDLTAGGIAGQDASRGNPFPRNAIQEYRVITQNFKAEYQKASSAIITATTRSGGNTWRGNAFFGYQNDGLVALDSFQVRDKHIADSLARANGTASTFREPTYTRSLAGLSIGGPIQRDRLFFFGSYEGNYQNRANRVSFTPPTGIAALDTVNLTQYNGNFTSPFRETLVFGKLTYAASPNSSAELSFNNRHETDVRDFGGSRAFQRAVDFRNDVSLGILKYSYFTGPWLNETRLTYERFARNPTPDTPGLPARLFHYPGQDAQIGSNLSTQDFIQKRYGIRNDLTYTGLEAAGQHVIKGGVNVDVLRFDITKRNNETPLFEYAQYVDPVNYGWTTDPTALPFNFAIPYQLTYGTGKATLKRPDTQIGAYLQDDWSPIPRLTLNLGIRWDFESQMINTDYVTPQEVVDTLTLYNDSLPTPLDLNRYISTGSNRKPFYGAFQPRLGFSYALDDDNKTTVFGGFGIYYDRSIFDFSVDEVQKIAHPTYIIQFAAPDSTPGPGQVAWNDSYLTADSSVLNNLVHTVGEPEAFLLDNKMRLPKSKQWNVGVRRVLGSWVASVSYQGQRGTDLFTYNWANFGLNPDGSCCTSFNIGAHGFRNIIYSTNDGRTWYDALALQVQRPFRRVTENGIGWGAGVTYTYAKRYIAGVDNLNDITSSFPGAFPNTKGIPKHSDNGGNNEQQILVGNWVTDIPYLFGIQFSGLVTLKSGPRLDVGCPTRFCGPATYINGGFTPPVKNTIIPGGWAYERIDVRLRKDFPEISGTSLGVTLDVFNLFNEQNLGCWDVGFQSPTYGHANCVVSDPRRAELGVQYNF